MMSPGFIVGRTPHEIGADPGSLGARPRFAQQGTTSLASFTTTSRSGARVRRSLYQRAVGYNYKAVKIFMPANREKPVIVPYMEHVPADPASAMFWLKNREPERWRDVQNVDHVLGRYIISDRPMTEEQWAAERATIIDEKPVEELPAPDWTK
jgi:hypothetical protein